MLIKRTIVAAALALGLVAASTALAGAQRAPARARFAFQPIAIQRIDLPQSIKSARWPVFSTDGRHLLFFSADELWITSLAGRDVHCLSCGLVNDPKSSGQGEVAPFPDGKRVFFGGFTQPGASAYAVLQCRPSVADCRSASILPADLSTAVPTAIPPGGAVSTPQQDLGGEYAAKLSQDGEYVGFSDFRSDSFEEMVVARLVRASGRYEATDPRVINPAGPTSARDPSVAAWSDSSALYEFKTFTDGGADATYVESGGPSLLNPDVWSINLATGRRTRLTSSPDWDEDNAVSPNGRLLALWSNRTMHYVDWLAGLLPVRDFIDAPASAMTAASIGSDKKCHGPMWVLPAGGDDGGTLAGQPIVDYAEPHVHISNNLVGWGQWSPNGTMLALNTIDDETGLGAPYLLVARFPALKPSKPLAPVSSQPGSWAPSPAEYHGAIGYDGTVTLHGPGGGSVTVTYGGTPGAINGHWSETYSRYSDDGKDFVTGTVAIAGSIAGGTVSSHLRMTGRDTGSDDIQVTLGSGSVTGHASSTYDGHTITGPPAAEVRALKSDGGCPAMLPKRPALQVSVTRLGARSYRILVTASVAGTGANEAATDTEPVQDATVRIGSSRAYTDGEGIVLVAARGRPKVTVTAGDTLEPAAARL